MNEIEVKKYYAIALDPIHVEAHIAYGLSKPRGKAPSDIRS